MPATFGVTNTRGLAPDDGFVGQSSEDSTVDVVTLRNQQGITVQAAAKKLITKTITVSGKGTTSLAQVTGGEVTMNQAMISSVKITESNDDFPEFEIQATTYVDN
jgi:hypothetical protein